MISVTFLGTGSGMPAAHRGHSAYIIASERDCVLLDAGEGVARAHAVFGIAFDACQRIYISHTHPDHVSGLPMLLQAMRLGGRSTALAIHMPPDAVEWLEDMLKGMHMHPGEWRFPLRILPMDVDTDDSHEISVHAVPNRHLERKQAVAARLHRKAESYSFAVSHAGTRLIFSSDIVDMDDILNLCEQAEILVIDTTHIPLEQIESFAMNHHGIRVICSHIPPESDGVITQRYPASFDRSNIAAAVDGMCLVIDRSDTSVFYKVTDEAATPGDKKLCQQALPTLSSPQGEGKLTSFLRG